MNDRNNQTGKHPFRQGADGYDSRTFENSQETNVLHESADPGRRQDRGGYEHPSSAFHSNAYGGNETWYEEDDQRTNVCVKPFADTQAGSYADPGVSGRPVSDGYSNRTDLGRYRSSYAQNKSGSGVPTPPHLNPTSDGNGQRLYSTNTKTKAGRIGGIQNGKKKNATFGGAAKAGRNPMGVLSRILVLIVVVIGLFILAVICNTWISSLFNHNSEITAAVPSAESISIQLGEDDAIKEKIAEGVDLLRSNTNDYAFSRSEAVATLTRRGYSPEVSIVAAEESGVDWDNQPKRKLQANSDRYKLHFECMEEAARYLAMDGFTIDQIIDAVESSSAYRRENTKEFASDDDVQETVFSWESDYHLSKIEIFSRCCIMGYTLEDARKAAEVPDIDFSQQALERAIQIRELTDGFSYEYLEYLPERSRAFYDLITTGSFTPEEALYAVDELNLEGDVRGMPDQSLSSAMPYESYESYDSYDLYPPD